MQWLVVAVRGTLSNSDFLTDVNAHVVPFLGGTAHEGIAKAAYELFERVGQSVRETLAANPELRLVLCGHSMGAGVAALTASLCAQEPWGAGCVCFAVATPSVVSIGVS